MSQPKTRQELYEQIRKTSKQEFILSEMIRLGFWEEGTSQPSVPADIIKERGELQRELNKLMAKARKLENPDLVLKEYRQKRLKESKEKQQENREKREKERLERAEKWKERKSKEIVYLGEAISGGLQDTTANEEQLKRFGLPNFEHAAALAAAMEIDLGQLRFLAYNRKVSKVSHYKRFYMAKKTGGKRLISAPMPHLKSAQYWILENILNKVSLHEGAHGFRQGHSIVTNAQQHVGQDVVINFDFKDFFPTITFKRVKGCFVNLGYSEQIASVFAALCTEPDVDEIEMDGHTYYVAKGPRHLPQGAPTSPALTNIICYKLDARMTGMCKALGFNYSRYADDMSFSTSGEAVKDIGRLIWSVHQTAESEGFHIHPDKTRVMRKNQQQEVTGIVVNEQLGIDRKELKKFRALLHQIRQTGMAGKSWGAGKDLAASIWGYANFVAMVKPEKGAKLVEEVKQLLGKQTPTHKTGLAAAEKDLARKIAEEKERLAKQQEEDKKDGDSWKMW